MKFEGHLAPVEVLIDNEAGNTNSTHCGQSYLHDIEQQLNLWESQTSGHPIALAIGGDISLHIMMLDNFRPSLFW